MANNPIDEVVERLTIHSAHYPDLRVLLAAYQSVRSENSRFKDGMLGVRRAAHLAHEMLLRSVHGEPAAAQFVESCLKDIRAIATPDIQRIIDEERFYARTGGTE